MRRAAEIPTEASTIKVRNDNGEGDYRRTIWPDGTGWAWAYELGTQMRPASFDKANPFRPHTAWWNAWRQGWLGARPPA